MQGAQGRMSRSRPTRRASSMATECYEIEVDELAEAKGLDNGMMARRTRRQARHHPEQGRYEINTTSWPGPRRQGAPRVRAQGRQKLGGSATFQAKFNPAGSLRNETKLHTNSCVAIDIVETLTEKTEHTIPVRVDVDAVFSKYVLRPANGLNFGPHVYDTESEPKTFEILNKGEFDFDFEIAVQRFLRFGEEDAKAKDKAKGRPGGRQLRHLPHHRQCKAG